MQFTFSILTLSMLAGLVVCAPSPPELKKRNECTITGWFEIYQDDFGNGVGIPTTTSGFYFNYVGGVYIGQTDGNSLAFEIIPQQQTGLAESINWSTDFFLSYSGCSASYEGADHTGYVNNNFYPPGGWGTGPGWYHGACSVDFGCEGNLH